MIPIDIKVEIECILEDWKVARKESDASGEGIDAVMIKHGVYDSFNNLMYALADFQDWINK